MGYRVHLKLAMSVEGLWLCDPALLHLPVSLDGWTCLISISSFKIKESIAYYFSTHGCGCFWSCLSSASFDFEPLDAAAAAARALLLKKLAAIASYGYLVCIKSSIKSKVL